MFTKKDFLKNFKYKNANQNKNAINTNYVFHKNIDEFVTFKMPKFI